MRALNAVLVAVAAVILAVIITNRAAGAELVTFNTKVVGSQYLDIGKRGPTIGDSTVVRWNLYARNGRLIGQGAEACRFVFPDARLCVGTYELPLGDISFAGVVRNGLLRQPEMSGTDGHFLSVTGGTSRYRAATGQLSRSGRTVYLSIN